MRRYAGRLAKCPREMIDGQPCHFRHRIEANVLTEMRVDVLTDAARDAGRQTAASICCLLCYRYGPQHADPWSHVCSLVYQASPDLRPWRSNQRAPRVATPDASQSGSYILSSSPREER